MGTMIGGALHELRLRVWARPVTLLLLALLPVRHAAATPGGGLTGHWEGTQRRGGEALSIAIDFRADPPGRGFYTSGDLGAMDVPLANVRLEAGRVHWELVGDRTTVVFVGRLAGGVVRGTFTEGDSRGSFVLRRTSASTQKPYTEQEVRFANGAVTLAGTLLTPRAPGRHPGVAFLHGSGPEGRWANRFTADFLARRGIVALIYDKRGVGGSGGDWRASTLEDLAADGRSAVALLASSAGVDGRCVGVFGHSQGGFIAPMVAAGEPQVRWIVNADGNAGPQYRQDLFRVETSLAKSYSGSDLANASALYREFVDVARNGLPHTQLDADVARFSGAPWLHALALPADSDWVWRWYRAVGNTDNSASWRAVRVPVLLLYGGKDEVVPPRQSIGLITSLLRTSGDSAVSVHVFPGADHTLRLAPASRLGWPRYAPGFPDIAARWIAGRCAGQQRTPAR